MTTECDLVVLVYRPDRIRSPISAENEHGDPYRATAEDETRRIDAPAERNEGDARQATVSGPTKDSHANVSLYAPFQRRPNALVSGRTPNEHEDRTQGAAQAHHQNETAAEAPPKATGIAVERYRGRRLEDAARSTQSSARSRVRTTVGS